MLKDRHVTIFFNLSSPPSNLTSPRSAEYIKILLCIWNKLLRAQWLTLPTSLQLMVGNGKSRSSSLNTNCIKIVCKRELGSLMIIIPRRSLILTDVGGSKLMQISHMQMRFCVRKSHSTMWIFYDWKNIQSMTKSLKLYLNNWILLTGPYFCN